MRQQWVVSPIRKFRIVIEQFHHYRRIVDGLFRFVQSNQRLIVFSHHPIDPSQHIVSSGPVDTLPVLRFCLQLRTSFFQFTQHKIINFLHRSTGKIPLGRSSFRHNRHAQIAGSCCFIIGLREVLRQQEMHIRSSYTGLCLDFQFLFIRTVFGIHHSIGYHIVAIYLLVSGVPFRRMVFDIKYIRFVFESAQSHSVQRSKRRSIGNQFISHINHIQGF